MKDFYRTEVTTTVVKHEMELPVFWTDHQALLRTVLRDMGHVGDTEPSDDSIWYEVGDNSISLCYQLTAETIGPQR